MGKLTISQLRKLKGTRQIIAVNAPDLNTACACAQAGVDNIVIGRRQPVEQTLGVLPAIRQAVPDIIITAVMPMDSCMISDELAIRDALRLMEGGADLVYATGMPPERIGKLAKLKIPCVSHLGLVPYFTHWTGGFRAMGKTAAEAEEIYKNAMALEKAGAVCAELECVPQELAELITKKVSYLTLSMGSGPYCDGQYLFAADLLGNHNGHYPRHSICYDNFYERSVNAFTAFINDVNSGEYPQEKHVVHMPPDELEQFKRALGEANAH